MEKHGSLLKKFDSFCQIDDFTCFLTKWGTFCNFLLKSSWKCQTMVVCSNSCKFSPNRWFFVLFHEIRNFLQLFPEKLIEMQRHGSLLEKLESFSQIDDFLCFFTNWATFCNLLLKSSSKNKNMVVCSKKVHSFGQIDEFSCFFTKWGSFCNFFLKSWSKCKDMVICSKCGIVLAKSMSFRAFSWNDALFFLKSSSKCKKWCFVRKVASFCQVDDFSCFFTKWGNFRNFLLKSSRKRQKMVVFSKSCKVFAQWMTSRSFHEMRYFVLNKSSKRQDRVVCSKNFQVLEKSMIFRAFSRHEQLFATFCCNVHRNAKTW